jgi:Fe-S-cluster containining protein
MMTQELVQLIDPEISPACPPGHVRLECTVNLGHAVMPLCLQVKDAPLTMSDVVDAAYAICDRIGEHIVAGLRQQGRQPSCRRGCAKCCKGLLVTVSVPESFRVLNGLASLPAEIRQRIDQAMSVASRHFKERPLPTIPPEWRSDKRRGKDIGNAYMHWWAGLRLPCSMLWEDACLIYPFRPCACREYLFTGPVDECQALHPQRVNWPLSMMQVLQQWSAALEGQGDNVQVGLHFPPGCEESHRARMRRTWPGPDMVKRLLDTLQAVAKKLQTAGGAT